MARGRTRSVVVLIVAASSACVPPPGARVGPTPSAPDVPDVPDLHVLTDDQASARGLTGDDLMVTFPDDESDGTHMLERWFARAQERGSFVGDIALYLVHDRESDAVECRTAIFPEKKTEAVYVPPSPRLEGVYRPVQRMVTHYEQRCRLVPHTETHMQTTYTQQYDYFSKTTRMVPQTRTVSTQVLRNECHQEPVTRLETQWEWGLERRYTPPRVNYLSTYQLREGDPVCYAVEQGAVTRVEGKVFTVH